MAAPPVDQFKNPIWLPAFKLFLSKVKIASKEFSEGPRAIELYRAQNMFLDGLADGVRDSTRHFVILKARQLGISTVMLVLDLFWLYMNPGLQGAMIADTADNRENFRKQINDIMESLPNGWKIPVIAHNRNELRLANGSVLQYLSAGKGKNSGLGRSRALSFVHATEISSWGDQKGIDSLMAALATENPNRLYIFESTALGYNVFFDMWEEAKKSHPTQKAIFIGWWAKDTYRYAEGTPAYERWWGSSPALDDAEDEIQRIVKLQYGWDITSEQWAWYRDKADKRSRESLQEEFPSTEQEAFVASGHAFFNLRRINEDLQFIHQARPTFNGWNYKMGDNFLSMKLESAYEVDALDLRVWEKPSKTGIYVIGVDPAFGRSEEADRSVISVWRCFSDKLVQVAEYATPLPDTRQVAWVMAHLASEYRDCVSEDTEILTQRGWKKHNQMRVGDEVAAFDPKTGTYQWEVVQNVIVKGYSGEMVRFLGNGIDCLVTPNHRVVFKKANPYKTNQWEVKTANEVAETEAGKIFIPTGSAQFGEGIPDLDNDLCRLLGLIMTDGWRGKYQISLDQSVISVKDGRHVSSEIDALLSKLGMKHTRHEKAGCEKRNASISWRFTGKAKALLSEWLSIGDIHALPRMFIEDASFEQASALFDGLLLGDGGYDRNLNKWATFCPGHSKNLAEGFQELAIRLGYSATVRKITTRQRGGVDASKEQYLVRLACRKSHVITLEKITREQYGGKVWCVTVPSGAFVMRRNGKVCVTGNCIINLEISGPGGQIMQELTSLKQHLSWGHLRETARSMRVEDCLEGAKWFLWTRPDSMGSGYAYNWRTNYDNKSMIFNKFRDMYSTEQVIVRSRHLLDEMLTLQEDGGRIAAQGRNKDDRVFAACLAVYAWDTWRRVPMMSENRTYEREMVNQQRIESSGKDHVLGNIVPDFFAAAKQARVQAYYDSLDD